MGRLRITDNHDFINIHSAPNDYYCHDGVDDCVSRDLSFFVNKKIKEIQPENNRNLLVFPRDLGLHGDDIGEGVILSMQGENIATKNIMGFIGVNGTLIDIISRFSKVDNEDFFLHYMLQKVFAINLFDIQHNTSDQSVFDFRMYLFPYFLKKALSQGLFKKYHRFCYNDSNVRGPIEINRHIRENIPFKGSVSYSTREFSYDNEVTQLVRHTIEYIRNKRMGNAVLNIDGKTKEYVSQIVLATPSYNVKNRTRVINQNIKPIIHPYYSNYSGLQKICLQILRYEEIKYGREKDKIYGILFDGACLWEEYLDSIFKQYRLGFKHAKNKTGETGIPLYEKGKRCYYPDFYSHPEGDEKGEKSIVLDAKYKRLDKGIVDGEDDKNYISICRDDLFQMITYMHVLPAKRCALVYPIELQESMNDNHKAIEAKPRKIEGFGGEIIGFGVPITLCPDYRTFCQNQSEVEKDLVDKIAVWMA